MLARVKVEQKRRGRRRKKKSKAVGLGRTSAEEEGDVEQGEGASEFLQMKAQMADALAEYQRMKAEYESTYQEKWSGASPDAAKKKVRLLEDTRDISEEGNEDLIISDAVQQLMRVEFSDTTGGKEVKDSSSSKGTEQDVTGAEEQKGEDGQAQKKGQTNEADEPGEDKENRTTSNACNPNKGGQEQEFQQEEGTCKT